MRTFLLTLLVLPALLLAPLQPAQAPAFSCRAPIYSTPYYAPIVSAPVYSPVVYHEPVKVKKVLVVEEKVAFPFVATYELFQYVAPPTLPPPVLLAAPASAAPAAQPVAAPAAVPSPCAQAAAHGSGIEARLARIEAALARLGGIPGETPDAPPAAPVEEFAVSQGVDRAPTPNLAAALGVLTACQQCHTSPGRDGIELFDAQGAFRANVTWVEIYKAVRGDRMPRGPSKLNPEQKALLKAMADAETTGALARGQ